MDQIIISDKLFIFDFQNLAYRTAMSIYGNIDSLGCFLKPYDFYSDVVLRKRWYDMFFETIFTAMTKLNQRHVPVIAVDSTDVWRKNIYPEYKAHRAKNRERMRDEIDYAQLLRLFEECVELLRSTSGFVTLKVYKCEADDIVGTLLTNNSIKTGHIIFSNDSDFKQLAHLATVYPDSRDFTIFSEFTEDQAQRYLFQKILCGDKATDNIPNIVFKVNEKTVEKFFVDKSPHDAVKAFIEFYRKDRPDCLRNYKRNRLLISLFAIPPLIQQNILAHYRTERQSYDRNYTKILEFADKNGLNRLNTMIGSAKLRLIYG